MSKLWMIAPFLGGCTKQPEQKGFENPEILVDPAWVQELTDGGDPAGRSDGDYVILHYNWGPAHAAEGEEPTDYESGHIPGAVHFDSDHFEDGYPTWYLKPDADIQATIESFGITKDTTVVVYSGWQIAAARGWWILKYAGVEDVRFLDGGYAAWIEAGGEAEITDNLPVPVDSFGAVVPTHPEYLATTEQVREKNANGGLIVDVRSWEEFTGETSGYDYIDAKGRISNAVWGQHCDDSSTDYLLESGALRTADEIAVIWEGLGASPSDELIVYCGGGWRSSLAFLYGQLMGYEKIRNYSSGWSEWSTNYGPPPDYEQSPSGNPVATGVP